MTGVHTLVDSPLGVLTLVASRGVVSGLYLPSQRYRPSADVLGRADAGPFRQVAGQLREYFAGERKVFDVEVALSGTPFQVRVWQALRDIPCGRTMSYSAVAGRLGDVGLSRAVGAANGRNPVAIIVPCHRVVSVDGALTGYVGGVDRKRWLLDWERRLAGR